MRIISFAVIISLLLACNSNKPEEKAFIENLDKVEVEGPAVSNEAISSILQQIPSPLEVSMLLKQSGSQYNSDLLNSPSNTSGYNTNYKKALNLGVYGTDLGYTNIYEQNQDGMNYMASIKTLANGLSIGQFFDMETLSRLASNSSNMDSLLLITTRNFNDINEYLQEQDRSNLSILFLTGGWIEAMHIITAVAAENPGNKELQEKVGEQKIILENIMLLLSHYSEVDENMARLHERLKSLQREYENVEITRTYKKSTFEVVDGVMLIKDNSTSEVKIDEETVRNIKEKVNNIRQSIIS